MTEPARKPVPTRSQSCNDGATCLLCGTALPLPEGAAPAAEVAGVPVALVECPGCGERQVRPLGAPLCDGERLALRHALEYLARRRGRT
ncbi:MAG TPA: hypothetical protein VFE37_17160 [Chloroflexota bacterium]|nr:hypothetical protein [Chloroflexota bacterium]